LTVKDVFDDAGLAGAVGIEQRRRHVPGYDAVAVARLRQAGAILVGKTNCPPSGSGGDTENVVYGRTLNPYDLTRTPGGSSGGDAAIVAAAGVPFSLGSDSGGSVRLPAHYCGVAALKPNFGRIPNTGAYNHPGGLTDLRTQIGPVARSVADLALLLPVLAGPDNFDSSVIPMPVYDAGAVVLSKLTVAYVLDDRSAPVTPETADTVGKVAQALSRAGVTVEQQAPRDFVRDSGAITEAWKGREALRGQDVMEMFNAWDHYRTRMLQFMERYDALICPVDVHPAPPFKERNTKRFDYTRPFSLTGWPVVVVRAGASKQGLPIGVQIAARPWREDVALAIGMAIEQEFGGWAVPYLFNR
jgi:amidase